MRILFLTQWFAPEPIFKGLPFAKELLRRGHKVEVLTGFPNYPYGKIYDGYRIRFCQREIMDGVPVIRVPLYASHDSSALKRIFNYISFAFAATVIGIFKVRSADVMYVYHPPATIGLPAAVIGKLRQIPIVYDIQDLWPDTLAATGMLKNKRVLGLVSLWCKLIYRQASRIVVLSPGFKNQLVTRGVAAEKVEVIYNWCQEEQESPKSEDLTLSQTFGEGDKFNVLFAGTMGKAHALDAGLAAAKKLSESYEQIQFVFVGGGVDADRLRKRAEGDGLSNVKFLPHRPMSDMQRVFERADVLLVHLKKDPLFRITIPSKTQAYLAAGKPILMGVEGDASELVQRAGAGVCCTPEDPDSIARAVIDLYSLPERQRKEMGLRGKEFYSRELSLSTGVNRFEEVFRSVTSKAWCNHSGAHNYDEIAEIHIKCLDQSFLSSLGKRFLALMYRCIDESRNSALFVSQVDGRVAGFVTGTTGFREIYKIMLTRYFFALAWALLPSLISPRKLLRILEILAYSKKHGGENDGLPCAELLSIAVDRGFRGKKIADALYLDLCTYFRREGVDSFRIVVGESLKPAHRFYLRMGAKPVATTEVHRGERSIIYVHDLQPSELYKGRTAGVE